MNEQQFEQLMERLEMIRGCIIDVETAAQEIKEWLPSASANIRSDAIPPRYCRDCVAFTVCAHFSPIVQGGPECLEVARRYSTRA